MEAVSVVGLVLAGTVLLGSLIYYGIKAYKKEQRRKQLLKIRKFLIV